MSSKQKRRVERFGSTIYVNTVGTSAGALALHTAEDAKTLIRTYARIKAFITGDIALPIRGEGVISVAPAGTTVADNPTTSQSLDNARPMQELVRFPFVATHNATGDYVQVDTIEIDTKAMRKLKQGDVIRLSHIASTANAIQLYGTVDLWFKE